jgi:hypothetical protein
MDNFIELDYDVWVETYRPIVNNIDMHASFDNGQGGTMFETYGEEIEFVKAQDENRIWMYGDGDDGGGYIWSGWGFVNRLGYFITEVPCPPDTTIQIQVSESAEECPVCGIFIYPYSEEEDPHECEE